MDGWMDGMDGMSGPSCTSTHSRAPDITYGSYFSEAREQRAFEMRGIETFRLYEAISSLFWCFVFVLALMITTTWSGNGVCSFGLV
jgi:hypothetical protein